MTDVVLVISGLTAIAPLVVAAYRDEVGMALYEWSLFVAMVINGGLFVLVENGHWPVLFLQLSIAAAAIVPALRIKLRKRAREQSEE